MNFHDQTIEMKRTLVEASVGRVTIASHNLESILKVILFSCLCIPDDKLEKEWQRHRPLGTIIEGLKKYEVFGEEQLKSLDSARKLRNRFTHRLSETYSQIIKSGAMFDLTEELEGMKREIDAAAQMAERVLHEHAIHGGVDVSEVKDRARKAVDTWESVQKD